MYFLSGREMGEEILTFNLTVEDRDFLLEAVGLYIEDELIEHLQNAELMNDVVVISMSATDIDYILGFIAAEANHTEDEENEERLEAIYDHIQEMNQRYRGINKPTDVLAFREDFIDPDLETRYLGDIVISYEQALNQAQTRGHPVDEELQLLVVHGTLHLLGYDHETPSDKDVMWSIQNEILSTLGLNIEVEDMID